MRRHLGPWVLGVLGLVLMAVSAVRGAGLVDRSSAPPGAIASTRISITVGDEGLFGSWTGEQVAAGTGVVTGLLLVAVSLAWAVRSRRRPGRRIQEPSRTLA